MNEHERADGIEGLRTESEFKARFGSEAACRRYLVAVRWRDGFVCPRKGCTGTRAWRTRRGLHRCAACGRQTSPTAGTIFAGTRTPLRVWFEVLWRLAGEEGISANTLQRDLGLGSYQTAWAWLHKLRRALATAAPEPLTGTVELAVVPLLGVDAGPVEGRGQPTTVAVALEAGPRRIGRTSLALLPDSGPSAIERFVRQAVAPGARLRTRLKLPPTLMARGYDLDPPAVRPRRAVGPTPLEDLARRLEAWIAWTHHGAIRRRQLDFYLAEFAFRFNHRASPQGLRFNRLLEAALAAGPTSARSLVGGTEAAGRGLDTAPTRPLTPQ